MLVCIRGCRHLLCRHKDHLIRDLLEDMGEVEARGEEDEEGADHQGDRKGETNVTSVTKQAIGREIAPSVKEASSVGGEDEEVLGPVGRMDGPALLKASVPPTQ